MFEGLNIQYLIYLQGENGVGAKILDSPLTTLLHNSFPKHIEIKYFKHNKLIVVSHYVFNKKHRENLEMLIF